MIKLKPIIMSKIPIITITIVQLDIKMLIMSNSNNNNNHLMDNSKVLPIIIINTIIKIKVIIGEIIIEVSVVK